MVSNKSCGEKGGSRGVWEIAFFFPKNDHSSWSHAFLGMVKHLLVHWKWWINPLVCFACWCRFCITYKNNFSQSMSFSTFDLPILAPIPPRGREGMVVWCSIPTGAKTQQQHWKRIKCIINVKIYFLLFSAFFSVRDFCDWTGSSA